MRRTALTIAALAALAACSEGSDVPPVAVRDVTGITDPVIEMAPDVTASPEPLDYVIEWTQVSDRIDEGRLTVPVDYADPQGDTIELYVARHRATAEPSAGPMLANRGGPGADGATLALDAFAEIGAEYAFESVRTGGLGQPVTVRKAPVGVVAGIAPWNVPLFIMAGLASYALSAFTYSYIERPFIKASRSPADVNNLRGKPATL